MLPHNQNNCNLCCHYHHANISLSDKTH